MTRRSEIDPEPRMTDLRDVVPYHLYRGGKFQYHAAHSKAVETRELYLRSARTEGSLADDFEQQLRATDGVGEKEPQHVD